MVRYLMLATESTMVKNGDINVALSSCLSDDSHLFIAYLREPVVGQFQMYIIYRLSIDKDITYGDSPILANTIIDIQIHNDSQNNINFSKAYKVNEAEPDIQRFPGNCIQLTTNPKVGTGFYLQYFVRQPSEPVFSFERTKEN
jgi:hypothetical protein